MAGWRCGGLLRGLVACLLLAAGTAALAQAGPAEYARRPDVRGLVVSPSNTHAALRVPGPKGRVALAVIDLVQPGAPKVIAAYDDVDVVEVAWVNDRRLIYTAAAPGPINGDQGWGTFAIDRDGDDLRHVIAARSDNAAPTGSGIRQRVLTWRWDFWRPVGDGSDDVLVTQVLDSLDRGYRPQVVARVDTRTMQMTTLSEGQPEGTDAWLFDAQGRLRIVTTTVKDRRGLWWKPGPDAAWERLHEWSVVAGDALIPVALEADGTLIVASRRGRDTTALFTYDLAKRRFDPDPLVGVEGFDVDGVRFDRRQQRVAGVPVSAQRATWVWFDEGLAKAQATVDKALPAGRANQLLCGHCIGAERFVVRSSSDRVPGEYYLFDAKAGKLTLLASSRPWLPEATQGRRTYHRVAARDGLSLPVVVTHPASVPAGQPAPTVVLVHGGPWVDGADLEWSAQPQFLASRGYRVLEVSFRGTTGLGWKHERASWGQWGLAMQDDLEDALLWAVREKHSDPARVCIAGASYGGYAALMGPVRHPGRYRCAVSHVGVTDISLLFSGNWTDINRHARTYGMRATIGDPEADQERFRQTSPLYRVADIKVPVLVVQGVRDRRVDPVHADRFVSAARAAGVDVQRINYDDGHGFSDAETHADYLAQLEAFLARHLKPQ